MCNVSHLYDTMVSRMHIENDAKQQLETASSILVFAPRTPSGTEAYLQLLLETIPAAPAQANVIAATYPKSAHEWLADWRAQAGDLPASGTTIDVGGMMRSAAAQSGDSQLTYGPLSITTADPTDPVELITKLSNCLDQSADSGTETVVSVETLTEFLEYADEETTFRYLYLLTRRLPASGAKGYFHIDPNVHDDQTINTLSGLVDAVVECSPNGDEWTTQLQGSRRDGNLAESGIESTISASPPSHDASPTGSLREWLSSLVMRLPPRHLWRFNGSDTTIADTEETPSAQPESIPRLGETPDYPAIPDEKLLTKDDRIRQLLYQHSGKMKQRAIVEETQWSASTVSRVLSTMEDNEQIRRVQVGREKIAFLDGHEPNAIRSSDR